MSNFIKYPKQQTIIVSESKHQDINSLPLDRKKQHAKAKAKAKAERQRQRRQKGKGKGKGKAEAESIEFTGWTPLSTCADWIGRTRSHRR